jgi:hypothetical protein
MRLIMRFHALLSKWRHPVAATLIPRTGRTLLSDEGVNILRQLQKANTYASDFCGAEYEYRSLTLDLDEVQKEPRSCLLTGKWSSADRGCVDDEKYAYHGRGTFEFRAISEPNLNVSRNEQQTLLICISQNHTYVYKRDRFIWIIPKSWLSLTEDPPVDHWFSLLVRRT